MVIGIAINVVMAVTIMIVGRCWIVRFVIWLIVNAAPVRDFWKRISVTKEIDMTIVLIEPRRIRNCSRVDLPDSSDAMIAAWDEPSPGKSEQIGDIKIVAMVGLMMSDFGMWSFSIFCSGRIVLDFIEWINVEVAKSPVRSGRRG